MTRTTTSLLRPALLAAAMCASCGYSDPIAAQLVFNELGATGNDFAELYNAGTTPLDISNYAVCDSRKDGYPKISRAIRIPAGTTLPPGGYLVILFEGECPQTSTAYVCVRGALGGGISQSRGESIHLIDPEDRVVESIHYPQAAAPSGWTWGLLPNGRGTFQVTRRTPGRANES